MHFNDILSYRVLGVELYSLGLAFLILLVTLITRKLFDQYAVEILGKITRKTSSDYDDMVLDALKPPISALILCMGFFYAVFAVQLPNEPYDLRGFAASAYRVAMSLIVIWAMYRLSNLLAEFFKNLFAKADEDVAKHFAPLISQAVRVTILILGVLIIIQNLGYSVGSILAGLGIGGLAIALAAQDTLANLFGTMVMIADKPFKIGDWVQFKDVDGNVESIGIRSTKVRTWSKSVKVIPNKLLTSEIIENWTAMPKRRVKMTLGITYDSPPEKVSRLRDRMEEILRAHSGVNQEYLLVYFTDFGGSALEIFVYYFTHTTVWKEYLEIRQDINLQFMKLVEEMGLSFAFPSQTVYFGDSLSLLRESDPS